MSLRPSGRVVLTEGAIIPWSPGLVLRMAVLPTYCGERRIPRRRVFRQMFRCFKGWFDWQTALPGDTFECLMRDVVVRVHHGVGSGRRVQVVTRQAMEFRAVRQVGLAALWPLVEQEPAQFNWWELERVR